MIHHLHIIPSANPSKFIANFCCAAFSTSQISTAMKKQQTFRVLLNLKFKKWHYWPIIEKNTYGKLVRMLTTFASVT